VTQNARDGHVVTAVRHVLVTVALRCLADRQGAPSTKSSMAERPSSSLDPGEILAPGSLIGFQGNVAMVPKPPPRVHGPEDWSDGQPALGPHVRTHPSSRGRSIKQFLASTEAAAQA
jgi:hypothetical protein